MRLELKRLEAEAAADAEKAPATNATKPLNLEPPPSVEDVLPSLEDKRRVVRYRSNFYQALMRDQRVNAVGFAPEHRPSAKREQVVHRADFGAYVLGNYDLAPQRFLKVEVEVVAPVLTRKALKWRGVFEKHGISFEIADQAFLDRVTNKRVTFQNGTTLVCDLVVHWRENETGDLEPYAYVVEKIHKHYTKAVKRRGNGSSDSELGLSPFPEFDGDEQMTLPLPRHQY